MGKNGRPTKYTQELADKVCSELADGNSMRTVCLAEEMPDKSTIFRWIRTHEEFRDQYTKAKEEGVEAWAEESMDIADDGSNDWMQTHDKDNEGYRANGENIQRSKLRIETRKWFASKLKPKKYGDKHQIEHSGGIGLSDMSEDALNKKLQETTDFPLIKLGVPKATLLVVPLKTPVCPTKPAV